MTHDSMAAALLALKCRSNFSIKNVTEYMLPGSKEPVYLHLDGRTPLLIIRPAFELFAGEFAAINGVHARYDYHHNAQMTRFPKRLHKSLTETHYGLAFGFDHVEALEQFIARLLNIIQGH